MAKKFLRDFLPSPGKIKQYKVLKIFGDLIHSVDLWHFNRRSVSLAFAVGVFCAFIPIPFQMVLAAAMAIIVQANLPISVALVWLTNPATMPAVYFFTYKVGTKILHTPHQHTRLHLSWQWLLQEYHHIWKPLLLGSVICGIIAALFSYIAIRILWRISVIRSWKQRGILQRKKKH